MKKKLIIALLVIVSLTVIFTACDKEGEKKSEVLALYELDLTYSKGLLSGREEVLYVSNEEGVLNCLKFHLYANAFNEGKEPFSPVEKLEAYYSGESYGKIEIHSVKLDEKKVDFTLENNGEILTVPTGPLNKGDSATVELEFTVTLPKCRGRLGITESTINLGNFYPVLCVYENGKYVTDGYSKFGDPFYTDVADYYVTLNVPSDMEVAHTGEATESKTSGDTKTIEILAEKTRDFAAVMSQNFKKVSSSRNGVEVSYFYLSDPAPESTLDIAHSALMVFSSEFGPYPYKTMAIAETPFTAGGMEYTALAMIASGLNGSVREETVIHEIAHQWWYGVVGSNQIAEPWLDEALTEFCMALYFKLTGDISRFERIMAEQKNTYSLYCDFLRNNGKNADGRIAKTLNEFSSSSEYVIMTYSKGAIMFHTLYEIMGQKKFIKALNTYYQENLFSHAHKEDLISAFEKHKRGAGKIIVPYLEGTVVIN